MIKEVTARAVILHAYCDDCKEELSPEESNISLLTYPAQYAYICPKCKKTYYLDRPYPTYAIVEDLCRIREK